MSSVQRRADYFAVLDLPYFGHADKSLDKYQRYADHQVAVDINVHPLDHKDNHSRLQDLLERLRNTDCLDMRY